MKVLRSVLQMPIDNARFVDTVWKRNCDGVILDLEDAVGEEDKPHARTLCREAIAKVAKAGATAMLRINHMYWEADLEAAIWPGRSCLARVTYPKCESGEEVRRVDAKLSEMERRRGIKAGSIGIRASVETVRGVVNAYEIASASPRVRSFGGGAVHIDMARDLAVEMMPGMRRAVDFYNTCECELVALALGLVPDVEQRPGVGVGGDVVSGAGAYDEAVADRRNGIYGGRIYLHPNWIDGVNRGYVPPPEEVAEARGIIRCFEELDARGEVEGEFRGKVVDKWEERKARKLLDWAEACARKDQEKAAALERAKAAEQMREEQSNIASTVEDAR